jgi:hypothetical protein
MKNVFLFLFFITIPTLLFAQSGQSEFKSVRLSKIPRPVNPPELEVSDVVFSDEFGNQDKNLDANEKSEIRFILTNKGKGEAYAVVLKVEELTGIRGLIFPRDILKGTLLPGASIAIQIPVQAEKSLPSAKCNFRISAKEGNGFNAQPFLVAVNTKEFRKPDLVIADALFSNQKEEGKIVLGEKVLLDILLKNKGEGEARKVKVRFINPANVFPGARDEYELPALKPGEERHLNYEFFGNKQYQDSIIPITIKISEESGEYGISDIKRVSLEQSLTKTDIKTFEILGMEQVINRVNNASSGSLLSDVDRNIPISGVIREKVRAIIIGNEDYSKYQDKLSVETNVDFARNDARVFREYCEKTLGVPAANIDYLSDAISSKIRSSLTRLSLLIKKDPELEVIFFYAGHGLPDPETKEPYLIPVDVSGQNFKDGIKLADVYRMLGENPSPRVTVFVDACFSGGARNKPLDEGARGVKIKPNDEPLKGNMVVYTASSGKQSSHAYREQKHGMFTYYLLKTLQESKGNITYQELGKELYKKVSFQSVNINRLEQDPQFTVSPDINPEWINWKLK